MNRDMSGSVRGLIDEMLTGSVAGNVNFESSGGSNVTITPTLESGTKIADFTIDEESGVLYAPTPEPSIEYTAGDNITISEENVISATDTTYTAGANIQISENNVISATSGGVNYSTEEQVVGTWIDGSIIYSKTFRFTNREISNTSDVNIGNVTGSISINQFINAFLTSRLYKTFSSCACYLYNGNLYVISDLKAQYDEITLFYTKTE